MIQRRRGAGPSAVGFFLAAAIQPDRPETAVAERDRGYRADAGAADKIGQDRTANPRGQGLLVPQGVAVDPGGAGMAVQIGRPSCRARVCQTGENPVVSGSLK